MFEYPLGIDGLIVTGPFIEISRVAKYKQPKYTTGYEEDARDSGRPVY
jgi:hypothetical protein